MKTLRLMLILTAGAAGLCGAAHAQIGKSDAPIKVDADHFEYFQNEGRGIYTGNVRAAQADNRVTADKLTVVCARPEAGTKNTDCQSMDQMIAEGNVLFTAPDMKIRGDHAEYDYTADTVTITGDVYMSRKDEAVAHGNKVVYNVGGGITRITADGGRVSSLFQPKKKTDEQGQPPASPTTPPASPPN